MGDGEAGCGGSCSRGVGERDALGGGRGWLQESSPPRTPASPFAAIPANRIKVLRGQGAGGSGRACSSPVTASLRQSPGDTCACSAGSPDGNSMGQGPQAGARRVLHAQSGENAPDSPDGASSLDPARPAQVEERARSAQARVQGAATASSCTSGGTSGGSENKSRSGRTRKRAGRQVPAPRTPVTPTHALLAARPADENQDPQSSTPSADTHGAGRASRLFADPAVIGHCQSPPPPESGGKMAPSASPNAANTGGRVCATGSPRAHSLYGSWLHATPQRPSPGTAAEKV